MAPPPAQSKTFLKNIVLFLAEHSSHIEKSLIQGPITTFVFVVVNSQINATFLGGHDLSLLSPGCICYL